MKKLYFCIMNKLKIFLLAPLFVFLTSEAQQTVFVKSKLPANKLSELNHAIKHSAEFEKQLETKINSLKLNLWKNQGNDATSDCHTCLKISEMYNTLNTDSALHYSDLAHNISYGLADPKLHIRSDIAILNNLSTSGIFSMAVTKLDSLKQIKLDLPEKIEMWKAGRQLYGYMMSYLTDDSQFFDYYKKIYLAYDDSLLLNLPKNTDLYRFLEGERLVSEGRYNDAQRVLQYLIDKLPINDNLFGKAAYQMAIVYRSKGNEPQYASYLALAARSDIETCVKEGLALPALAMWLYGQGRLDDAFRYINFALQDAMSGNTRMRTATIASMVPVIDEAYKNHISSSRDRLFIYLSLCVVLLILSAILLSVLLRQNKRSHETQAKLAEISTRQNSYIGNFIGLCSTYADKLDSLNKLVSVKISTGHTDELLKMIKSGRFGESSNDLYTMFDNAFLDLYPDFLFEINKLLRDDEQIYLKKGENLSPELRIYALVRLGVEESTRIASILHYSVSTIYTYRNRMRNKAINREDFDSDVTKICRN